MTHPTSPVLHAGRIAPDAGPSPADATRCRRPAGGGYAVAAHLARVAEWQTRRTQNPLPSQACGFKSRSGHQRSSPAATSEVDKARGQARWKATKPRQAMTIPVGCAGGSVAKSHGPRTSP